MKINCLTRGLHRTCDLPERHASCFRREIEERAVHVDGDRELPLRQVAVLAHADLDLGHVRVGLRTFLQNDGRHGCRERVRIVSLGICVCVKGNSAEQKVMLF